MLLIFFTVKNVNINAILIDLVKLFKSYTKLKTVWCTANIIKNYFEKLRFINDKENCKNISYFDFISFVINAISIILTAL